MRSRAGDALRRGPCVAIPGLDATGPGADRVPSELVGDVQHHLCRRTLRIQRMATTTHFRLPDLWRWYPSGNACDNSSEVRIKCPTEVVGKSLRERKVWQSSHVAPGFAAAYRGALEALKSKDFMAAGPVSRVCPPDCSGGTAIPLGEALLGGSSEPLEGFAHRIGPTQRPR
jgi:hypothetical protein